MKRLRAALAILVAAGLLAAILARIELDRLGAHFAALDWGWFGLALAAFIPIFGIRATLLRVLMVGELAIGDALRCILAASSLNAVLPSKAGDLAKSVFLRHHLGIDLAAGVSAVILERVLDVTALVLVLLVGLLFMGDATPVAIGAGLGGAAVLAASIVYFALHLAGPADRPPSRLARRLPKIGGFFETSRRFVRDAVRTRRIVPLAGLALALWVTHVFQFYCFFQALGYQGPWLAVAAYVPAAIFIGLLPISIAGIGTRDVALIALFAPWTTPELAAGVGLLSHLRYILPGLIGAVVVRRYVRAR